MLGKYVQKEVKQMTGKEDRKQLKDCVIPAKTTNLLIRSYSFRDKGTIAKQQHKLD